MSVSTAALTSSDKPSDTLWSRSFVLVSLSSILLFTSFYVLLPVVPAYASDILLASKSQVGAIMGLLSFAALVSRPIAGWLLDHVGRRPVLIASLIGYCGVVAGYRWMSVLWLLLAWRTVHGAGWGFATTSSSTVAADLVPAERRGEGLGYYGVTSTIAMAVGPSVGVMINRWFGFSYVVIASTLLSAAALVAITSVQYPHPTPPPPTSWSNRFIEPSVRWAAAINAFIATAYGGIISFVALYGRTVGATNEGLFFVVFAVGLISLRPIAGRLYDRHGPRKLLYVGLVLIAVSFAILASASTVAPFLAAALVLGFGFGVVSPTLYAASIDLVEPSRRGAATGTLFSAFDLGITVGSFLLGMLAKYANYTVAYLTCSLIAALSIGLVGLLSAQLSRASARR